MADTNSTEIKKYIALNCEAMGGRGTFRCLDVVTIAVLI